MTYSLKEITFPHFSRLSALRTGDFAEKGLVPLLHVPGMNPQETM